VSFLVDTNIISELRKGNRRHPRVGAWYASVREEDLYLSVLVTGEIRKGVEKARAADALRAAALEAWLDEVTESFGARLLDFDGRAADAWGRLSAGRTLPVVDAQLAATAWVHGLTLVTRNTADLAGVGVALFNPFLEGG
jgi:toxin FitB